MRNKKATKWTEDMIIFIVENSSRLSDKEMSKILGVGTNPIQVLRYKLGIYKDRGAIRKRLISEGKIIPARPSKKTIDALYKNHENFRGKTYEELFGKEKSEEMKKKSSERMKSNNPSKGGLSEDHKKKIGLKSKKNWENKDFREKNIKAIRSTERTITEDRRKEMSESAKRQWRNEKSRKKLLKGLNLSPNTPERILTNIISKYNLPFIYVGDGKVWIKGVNHTFNPDFISENTHRIIEIFGEYHHNLPKNKCKDKDRILTYREYGYETLIIWSKEVYDEDKILIKISDFLRRENG